MSLLGWLRVSDGELDRNSLCLSGCITSEPGKSPFLSIFSLFLFLIPHMLYRYLLLVRLCSIMNMTDKELSPLTEFTFQKEEKENKQVNPNPQVNHRS